MSCLPLLLRINHQFLKYSVLNEMSSHDEKKIISQWTCWKGQGKVYYQGKLRALRVIAISYHKYLVLSAFISCWSTLKLEERIKGCRSNFKKQLAGFVFAWKLTAIVCVSGATHCSVAFHICHIQPATHLLCNHRLWKKTCHIIKKGQIKC